jgi:hypothetical protein
MNLDNFRPMKSKIKSSAADAANSFSVSSFQTFNKYVGHTKFELKYLTGRPLEYFLSRQEAHHSTCAMAWCMRETEVARLFTREDLYEFLFRLQILFQSTKLVEYWIIDGYLLSYTYKGLPQVLNLENILMHFGLEAYNHCIAIIPQEKDFLNVCRHPPTSPWRWVIMRILLTSGCRSTVGLRIIQYAHQKLHIRNWPWPNFLPAML